MLKVLEEEIRILQIENQKLRNQNLDLTEKSKLLKQLPNVIKIS
jgi:hypothetical protein